jgi:sialate O-acetylesterase
MKRYLLAIAILAGIGGVGVQKTLAVQLASPFTDNMVLQQGQPVPVWGTAVPGERVTVQFGKQNRSATVGPNGQWKVFLKTLKASTTPEALNLTVTGQDATGGVQTVVLTNVVVGEVWLCSGQSNMEFLLSSATNAQAEILGADYPGIRMFTVTKGTAATPQTQCQGRWIVCSRETAGSFSAVGYFFARRLHQDLNVPVGMLNTSWGGSPVEPWTSLEVLRTTAAASNRVAAFESALSAYYANRVQYDSQRAEANKKRNEQLAAWNVSNVVNDIGEREQWFTGAKGSGEWKETAMPMPDNGAFLSNYIGSVWCRVEVAIPPTWVGRELSLNVGAVDEIDTTYVNGTKIGETQDTTLWTQPRHYVIPPAVTTGTNLLIIMRVDNQLGGLGVLGLPRDYSVVPVKPAEGELPISLVRVWHYAMGTAVNLAKRPNPSVPSLPGSSWDVSTIYNAMVAPLVPYALRGAIWYQGESNASQPNEYAELFPALIKSWRKSWAREDFPFLFVQLANFMARQQQPVEPKSWADLRQSQTRTLAVPQTGMAVTIDIGAANDIHPRNKQDVGNRLALWALAKTYGKSKLVYSGPLYRSMKASANEVVLQFEHVGGGLEAHGPPLVGFAVAGTNKVFYAASARIEKNAVIVRSEQVPEPVAVRYGWANNPICNLFNREGLPASPFRTDTWRSDEIGCANEVLVEPAPAP